MARLVAQRVTPNAEPDMARRLRVLNTCLYPGFRADLADREEAEIP